ncbi:porin family protein [Sediminibacterium ginsengisoli]|uniref:Outer membrane protein beta-barrel domain-containing protein n=1 Tax=Sediminibacterium ginsengisoli TaxID=413434 RepID=A0A1T4L0N6_9BACT|nr:porin family protein [Sediminibacterium ginsengisoli]SJZ48097.1 Outer membrane protein beta-barrel domain-containing protein [Sediminibacterium ginsengisoli]
MKRLLLACFAIAVFTGASYAQGGFRLGAKLGANLNKVDGVSFKDGFDFSYHAGGWMEIDFNKKWGVQPEVLFNQSTTQRSSFNTLYPTYVNPSADPNGKIKLNYLSIPILLRYNIGNLVTLNAGPQFGILLSQDKDFLQNGKEAFKSGDFSMVGGIQLNLSMLRIYGRYNIGLSNINDIDNQDKWKNQQIQLGLGLKLL